MGFLDPRAHQRGGHLRGHRAGVGAFACRRRELLLLAALVLAVINAAVRPVMVILTLPLTVITLGLFLLVLNAVCLWLVTLIVPGVEVRSFGSAFLGALIISAVSWVLTADH